MKGIVCIVISFISFPSISTETVVLTKIISEYKMYKEKNIRVKLLSGIPLRPFSENLAENKDVFTLALVEKNPLFSFICFPNPPVLVWPMKIALTDRCSYCICNKSLKNMTKTAAAPFCVLLMYLLDIPI